MTLHIGSAQRALMGQSVCGDALLVIPGERTTIVLADGLGHGPLAAEASAALCAFVEAHVTDCLEDVLRGASQAMAHTRGAAGAIMRIDERTLAMEFAGIGNVEVQAVSERLVRPFCVPGIIGRRLRKVLRFEYALAPGDLLALYSDGVSSRFELCKYADCGAKDAATAILAEHGKSHDDATCIVVRC
ncbi:MAG: SpoIIE family protein phosphatase [Deltaproteobacteria bacterium]|nr:SpoIIE family protein phosphatase [Deltaproteobacteria bacterium]